MAWDRLDTTGSKADEQHPGLPVDRAQRLVEGVTSDWVVDDIGAFATGQRAHPVTDAFFSIIDQLVCAPRGRHCQFFRAASRGDDPRPHRFADLDRRQPDPAGGAEHQ